ncbi:MAG TPA: RES family NAD+ phosphorylase [Longimicrobium sp.]|nr:RES family NAD+ phosphorylase [Longimicrobium sp.]
MARDDYHGPAFRQCHPDYTDLAATARVSPRHPFRFNPLGEFGVLYVALSERTAHAELVRQADRRGVAVEKMAPRVMLLLDVRLSRVLDLTDGQVREAWDVTLDELASDDYQKCQEVARVARREGYEAIRYPSATGEGENLAIFFDHLRTGSAVEVVRANEYPLAEPPSPSFLGRIKVRIFGGEKEK